MVCCCYLLAKQMEPPRAAGFQVRHSWPPCSRLGQQRTTTLGWVSWGLHGFVLRPEARDELTRSLIVGTRCNGAAQVSHASTVDESICVLKVSRMYMYDGKRSGDMLLICVDVLVLESWFSG